MIKNKKFNSCIFILLLIFILAIALRIYRLGSKTLETDEISGVYISKVNVGEIFRRNLNPHLADITVEEPPLPYMLAHFALELKDNDFMARLASAILGSFTILVLYFLVKTLLDRGTALWASFLLSISLYHISYSQLFRGYSGLTLFSLLSLCFLWKLMHDAKLGYWVGFIFANSLGLYFHYIMLQIIVIETSIFLIGVYLIRDSIEVKAYIKKYLICLLIIFLTSCPLLPNILSTIFSRIGSRLGDESQIKFEFNINYFRNLLCRYGAGNGLAFYIYNSLFFYGIVSLFRRQRMVFLLIAFWIAFPFLLLAHTGYKYFFHIRYFIYIFPMYLVIIAYGITRLSNIIKKVSFYINTGLSSAIIVFVFIGLSCSALFLYYRMPARMTDWKETANYIDKHCRDGLKVYVESSFSSRELKYYLDKIRPDIKLHTFNGQIDQFIQICSNNQDILFVNNSYLFDHLVQKYFNQRVIIGSSLSCKLGKRELIDWDNSWFPPANIKRYFLTLYYNENN